MKNIINILIIISINLIISQTIKAETNSIKLPEISSVHANKFGNILVQDFKGRIKPMNTLNLELLRKLSRKDKYKNQNADQVVLGIIMFPEKWTQVSIIKIGRHPQLLEILNSNKKYLSYNDFFDDKHNYKLKDLVNISMRKETRRRNSFDKELLKLDERINIFNMIINKRFINIFPDPYNSKKGWMSPNDARIIDVRNDQNLSFISKLFPAYTKVIIEATNSNDWAKSNIIIEELRNYQQSFGVDLPHENKVKAELFLNKFKVFSSLRNIYGLLGFIILIMFFIKTFNPKRFLDKLFNILYIIVLITFFYQTLGLGLRWYVSGRAPWSNGYESLIYISFTTMLAGVIFGRKSWGGLASALILSSVILMVAGFSLFDPEITPLVPVLKSYWLTIHVSLEAGSYGFLMLGAVLGVINLILMVFISKNNKPRVLKTIKELTIISEMTILAGLVMVTIGTHLGGIWANESWGRYWGWDPKETWALVTVLIYVFILHMRFIPGLKGLFAFNFSTLIGFASVMMTYFGVNYFLSGLHSYASGDPIPIPSFVYYIAIILLIVSLFAFIKSRRLAIS